MIFRKTKDAIRRMQVSKLGPNRPSRYGRQKRKCWSQIALAGMGKSGFPALPRGRYFLADNKGLYVNIWANRKLFLAYCLCIRPILNKLWRKNSFAPIGCNAEAGPALPIAMCRENGDALHRFTEISGPA